MAQMLTQSEVVAVLRKQAADLTAHAEELRALDAAIGDGDLGITVTIGFQAVCEALPELEDADLRTLLMRAGMAFNRKAASTFGALYATMMMRAARVAGERQGAGIDASTFAAMVSAAVEGVQERGKAQRGDKTLLDALIPAAEAATAAAEAGASLSDVAGRTAEAAEEGARATVAMKSRTGRASWFSDRTEGVQDPGATAVSFMLRSFADYVAAR
ncbi:MAG TPA: dihydroxyacetone kinase subunit L [Chloroflexi bacterium]|jgi:dihydroxyacetone kinase-like protein|nr:dihydroxyacetone kinase subunit L [Chloroflexota bacterium]